MRLVRLERQQSRVADDVRAALASLGRGSTVIGGIALVGVGSVTERPIEAVVLLPHGVIIVIGVDLPDPALRLEAPLGAEWRADGWPLVADDDAINPATEALDISQACERRIAALVPGTGPVGTIVAVGPYVETVDQPATDLAGPVRVLHPTPTTMLAATVSLATAHRPRSVDQVRALIRGLAPEAPEFSDEVLLGEGFSRFTDDSPPESLWDSGPAVPSQGEPAVATGAGAAAAAGSASSAAASASPVRSSATAASDSTSATGSAASAAANASPAPGSATAASSPASATGSAASAAANASPAPGSATAASSPASATGSAASAEANASSVQSSATAAGSASTLSTSGSAEPSSPADVSSAAASAESASPTAASTEPSSPANESPAAKPTWPTGGSAAPSAPAEDSPPTAAEPAAGAGEPSSPTVDSSGWHTKTPTPDEAEPAPSPAEDSVPAVAPQVAPEADLVSAPPNSGAEASPPLSAESERTEVLSPPADSEHTEKLPSPADSERTEKLPAPAAPALPLFPGAAVRPDSTQPSALAADSERTENLTTAAGATTPWPTTPKRPDHTEPAQATPTERPAHTEPARTTQTERPNHTQPARTTPTEPEPPTQTEPAKPTPPANPQATHPQPLPDSPPPFPTPRPTPRETAPTSKTVRWIPLAAIGLLVALVVAAIVVATSGDNTDTAAPIGPPTPATQPQTQPPPQTSTPVAQSLQFSLRAADHDQRCASHAFGDAQASLQQTSCSGVRRASYAAVVDGRAAAVTIGIVEFADAAQAAAFKAVADTPGGGGVLDLATETGKWGATPAPRFENAAYASKVDGTSVRLVQAVWAPGPSTPDDPGLTRAVQAALSLPAQ